MIFTRQTLMMCAADYFDVTYVINHWMRGQVGNVDVQLAQKQWRDYHAIVSKLVDVQLVDPQPNQPDYVFTANAGFVIGNRMVNSHFRTAERQREEPFNQASFMSWGYELVHWPQEVCFEGAGDALLDRGNKNLWCGYGFRSDMSASRILGQIYDRPTIALHLINPRFYHLDTCFCPLEGGYAMYYPGAFDAEALEKIEANLPADKRIVVGDEDAAQFACNTVNIGNTVIMNHAGDALRAKLAVAGFEVITTPLTEFLKAGGAAKCLTLKLLEV
ncbi:MAG: nitrate reductase [Alphaproteobacteria bacterium]|nr:nitrate reductase [Alphaproteobacteria bacterium]MBV8548124.1 nitrate reductase [Alphaproteobacteria bacterium]